MDGLITDVPSAKKSGCDRCRFDGESSVAVPKLPKTLYAKVLDLLIFGPCKTPVRPVYRMGVAYLGDASRDRSDRVRHS